MRAKLSNGSVSSGLARAGSVGSSGSLIYVFANPPPTNGFIYGLNTRGDIVLQSPAVPDTAPWSYYYQGGYGVVAPCLLGGPLFPIIIGFFNTAGCISYSPDLTEYTVLTTTLTNWGRGEIQTICWQDRPVLVWTTHWYIPNPRINFTWLDTGETFLAVDYMADPEWESDPEAVCVIGDVVYHTREGAVVTAIDLNTGDFCWPINILEDYQKYSENELTGNDVHLQGVCFDSQYLYAFGYNESTNVFVRSRNMLEPWYDPNALQVFRAPLGTTAQWELLYENLDIAGRFTFSFSGTGVVIDGKYYMAPRFSNSGFIASLDIATLAFIDDINPTVAATLNPGNPVILPYQGGGSAPRSLGNGSPLPPTSRSLTRK